MSDTVLIPGGRDVRATLDVAAPASETAEETKSTAETETTPRPTAEGDATVDDTDAVVVACPPHPEHGGHRGDERLTAVSDALTTLGVDCLRFDYGEWDEGYGECTDADNAVGWAAERYDRVGLFGFSFGGTVALVTAASRPSIAGVCALAPTARLTPEADAVDAIDTLAARSQVDCDESTDRRSPVTVAYATRDSTADWEPVVDRAETAGITTVAVESDHFFVGRAAEVSEMVADALVPWMTL
ncbi:MAG: alpha/beta hydrolase [Halorubrum sp.]